MKKEFKRTALLFISLLSAFLMVQACSKLSSQKISVAVAANFIKPFGEIAAAFEAETGIKVEVAYTSSGNLYSQITGGAPYDLFFSADEARPARLFEGGLADSPFVYAKGRIVLWTSKMESCSARDWKQIVRSGDVKKIAIANPDTAPYGTAALKAIRAAGLESYLKPRLVTAQSIAQAFQYTSTGAADAGFCALSSAYSEEGKKGCFVEMSEAPDIIQSACILKRTENRKAVDSFVLFIMSEKTVEIKAKYGYK